MRRAQCECGAVQVEAQGEQESVVACSCGACQRRSGSPFGMGLYYPRERLTLTGAVREYVREAVSGKPFHQFFCETCGSTVYWFSDRDPNRIGIAVGAFNDPASPRPERTVFDDNKHTWLSFPADVPGFARGRDSTRTR